MHRRVPLSSRLGTRGFPCGFACERPGGVAGLARLLGREKDGPVLSPTKGAMEAFLFDAAGRRRSPATMPGFHRGRPPRNKGLGYPPDPPSVEEIVAVMRVAGNAAAGVRMRALIVVLWRAGLRISEALALAESDLDQHRGAILVRRGKGRKRREVGMDRWAWEQLKPWLEIRTTLPVGMLLCVIHGPTRGRPWAASSAREELRAVALRAGVRRRFVPHQLCHAYAVERASRSSSSGLTKDIGGGPFWHVLVLVPGDRHFAGLGGVRVLTVASTLAGQLPTVLLDQARVPSTRLDAR